LSNNRFTKLPAEIAQLRNLTDLNLNENILDILPSEISELQYLLNLEIRRNQFTKLPTEIFRLKNLERLDVYWNRLTTVSEEIYQLQKLKYLNLSENQITKIPDEIFQLKSLVKLELQKNSLSQIPIEIDRLPNLKSLNISNNKLRKLPSSLCKLERLVKLDLQKNSLNKLPPEIIRLQSLNRLNLSENYFPKLPFEITQLQSLKELYFSKNSLENLPAQIAHLISLKKLDIQENQITEFSTQITQLRKLQWLDISSNHISTLPDTISRMQSLHFLYINSNKLINLPAGVSQLQNLKELEFSNNCLVSLPPEITQLHHLNILDFKNNPFTELPPEVVTQGQQALLRYLREQLEAGDRQWISKLLVVGEGGVGKTSLLRALRGESFNTEESTTHGIDITQISLPHPKLDEVTMQLNAWDFGGQEIYHATHQFFLTNRSLYVLAWNARHGFEQGRLFYWLKTIRANAPESPILLVATWIDERDADLPLNEIKKKFPRVIGQCEISNKTGKGIDSLRQVISDAAINLPLMGEKWPKTWLTFAKLVRSSSIKHTTPQRFWSIMAQCKVKRGSYVVLARWLHELGDILFFLDNPELRDLVILKPQWVTEYISYVLESDDVIRKNGIFSRECMDQLWDDIRPELRQHFLRLMERFDLSYRIPDDVGDLGDMSLVVERLPYEEPNCDELWEAINQQPNCKEISMRFQLSEILPGIPTWFIARQHRFSLNLHWRTGALFTYGPEKKHLGLVKIENDDKTNAKYLELTVRGPVPHNFFDLLKEGIEVTLRRYPGLQITRLLPCPNRYKDGCNYEFDYANLSKRLERNPPKEDIECPNCVENISVTQLLFGLHYTTQDAVLYRLDKLDESMQTSFQELRELLQREFLRKFREEQQFPESYCPSVFSLRPAPPARWRELRAWTSIASASMTLQLYCQYPGQWHPTETGGTYSMTTPIKWLRILAPHIRGLVKVMKYAAPLISPVLGVSVSDLDEAVEADVQLMTALIEKLPDGKSAEALIAPEDDYELERLSGAPLRALRYFLDKQDPQQHWGGLKRVLTPEGDYLWLCEKHAEEYASSYKRK
ncbi:MAG: COR domain-containing protein, partial [Cyanobacteria bacterium P01_D01_bin.156]